MEPIPNTTDLTWVLCCAALVMLMQAGFCCLESGSVRSKNSINVAIKNLFDFCMSLAIFWAFGFAVMFGFSRSGWLGTSGFFFGRDASVGWVTFFLFQAMFCGTATTIISGAVAERMRFTGYLVVSAIVSAVIYPVFGHWAWSQGGEGVPGGWLQSRGFIDFAGSTVVHSTAGWVALAATLVIGPRIGRFTQVNRPIRGHDLPMATLGVFLLWFGWFGFNGGSTLSLNERVPMILLNTCLGGAFGGIVGLISSRLKHGRFEVEPLITCVLAGLVGVTASCDVVSPAMAALIGSISGLICFGVTELLIRLKVDDVIGAVPSHACAGVWGTLAVALFGDPTKWGTGLSRWDQFVVQATGAGVCWAWAFGLGFGSLWLINRVFPLRVSPSEERLGLNMAEHGTATETVGLLTEMENHRQTGDFTRHVEVEPHTDIGQIAGQYNRVLDEVNARSQELIAARNEAVSVSAQLEDTVKELKEFNRVAVGRELRMIELKQQVNELAEQLDQKDPYDLSFVNPPQSTPDE